MAENSNPQFGLNDSAIKLSLWISTSLILFYFLLNYTLMPFPLSEAQHFIKQLCPNTEVFGTITSEFFRLPHYTFDSHTEHILWDSVRILNTLSTKLYFGFIFLLFCITALLGYVRANTSQKATFTFFFLVACSVVSITISLRVGAGWDEFFLNLRHSWNLINNGIFSANSGEKLEATVDLLPFLLVAGISYLSEIRLEDAAILTSLSGNILCVLGIYLLIRQRVESVFIACSGTMLSLFFPPLFYSGAAGFMAPLFAAMILFSFLLLQAKGRYSRRIGYGIIALMPLVRIEAFVFIVAFIFFVASADLIRNWAGQARLEIMRRHLKIVALLMLPFLALCLWRWVYFGDPIPIPVHYKSSLGSIMYLRLGLVQFFSVIDGYWLDKILIIGLFPLIMYFISRSSEEISFVVALVVLSTTYITGGGDWFPLQWARYWVPLFALALPLLLISITYLISLSTQKNRVYWLVLGGFLFGGTFMIPSHSENLYRATFKNDMMKSVDRWERTKRLSFIGQWFDKTLPQTSTIASSELATMMYYANRDLVALLGTTSAYGSRTPLQPLLSSPVVGKRRFPEVIEKVKPDVIALYEPINSTGYERDRQLYIDVVKSNLFGQAQIDINYYFAGDPNLLMKQGYRHVTVAVDQYVVSYWVSAKAYEYHMAALKALQAKPDGFLSFDYNVTAIHAKTYKSANTCS
ncbi:hypothetical protein OAS67_00805 [Alphaproteobacteria bacterium]|nr:hypothetical protein [Alphaproteobacteria bacterium]